jgi:hypothetical protein
MPSLTLKNIPAEIYEGLKQSARQNRRSLNGEALTLLAEGLRQGRRGVDDSLSSLRRLHERLSSLPPLDDDFLARAKGQGRP